MRLQQQSSIGPSVNHAAVGLVHVGAPAIATQHLTVADHAAVGLVHVGALLTLQGPGAYDAAVHCASVSAARRIQQQRDQPPGVPLPSTMHSVQSYR